MIVGSDGEGQYDACQVWPRLAQAAIGHTENSKLLLISLIIGVFVYRLH